MQLRDKKAPFGLISDCWLWLHDCFYVAYTKLASEVRSHGHGRLRSMGCIKGMGRAKSTGCADLGTLLESVQLMLLVQPIQHARKAQHYCILCRFIL